MNMIPESDSGPPSAARNASAEGVSASAYPHRLTRLLLPVGGRGLKARTKETPA